MIALILFIILIASILQTATGFGFSIMATPFLLLFFPAREAIQLNLLLSLLISIFLILKIKHHVDQRLVSLFIVGSIGGLPIGFVLFHMFSSNGIKMTVRIIILILTILLLLKFRIKSSRRLDIVTGGISGILTSSIGIPGPPLLLYFSGSDMKKETLRATTLAFYLFIYTVSVGFHFYIFGVSANIGKRFIYAVPVTIVGLYIGQWLFTKLNGKAFRVVTYIILICTGILLLMDSYS